MYKTRNLKRADRLRILAARAPDLLIGTFFNPRLRPAAFALAKLACLNAHPSLLPGTKRVDPVLRMLLRYPPPFVATLHIRDLSALTGVLSLDHPRLLFRFERFWRGLRASLQRYRLLPARVEEPNASNCPTRRLLDSP